MHQPIGRRHISQRRPPGGRLRQPATPPVAIDAPIGISIDEPQRDLGSRTVERDADWPAALGLDPDRTRGEVIRRIDHIAGEDPRMSRGPSRGAAAGDTQGFHAFRMDRAAASGSLVPKMAEITAIPAAPARRNVPALSAVMPPMATAGMLVFARSAPKPSMPIGSGASVLDEVEKTGPMPT